MIKKLKDLTLKEYDQYKELLRSEDFDIFEILKLLGYEDAENMDIQEFNSVTNDIVNEIIDIPQVRKGYEVGSEKRKFKTVLMVPDITAAQFIDFQSYMKDFKLHQILSVFLLPVKPGCKFVFKKDQVLKYNDGYDILEVQNYLYENFKIGHALSLSNFFLNLSVKLLPLIENSLIAQTMKMKLKEIKEMRKK